MVAVNFGASIPSAPRLVEVRGAAKRNFTVRRHLPWSLQNGEYSCDAGGAEIAAAASAGSVCRDARGRLRGEGRSPAGLIRGRRRFPRAQIRGVAACPWRAGGAVHNRFSGARDSLARVFMLETRSAACRASAAGWGIHLPVPPGPFRPRTLGAAAMGGDE